MMRALCVGLAISAVAGNAMAADYLRGSTYEGAPPPVAAGYDWSGVYVGGYAGYANADFQFRDGTKSLVADMVRALLVESEAHISDLPSLKNGDARAATYGGFIGYNAQWGEVVLGVDGHYGKTSMAVSSSDSIGRSFVTSNEFRNDVTINSNATARLTDYGSLRGRAGYAIGWIMPYATAGLAIGRVDYTRSASVRIVETDVSSTALDTTDGIAPRPGGTLNDSRTEAKNGQVTFGYSAGFGIDIGLTKNLFLRGEYEFVQFKPVGGIGIHISTVRAGAGLKF